MAVYTEVSDDALAGFLDEYDIGEAVSCKGIAEGVENSNYLLRTGAGHFVLTHYEERVDVSELPYFPGLIQHLAAHGSRLPAAGGGSCPVSCTMTPPSRQGHCARSTCDEASQAGGSIRRAWDCFATLAMAGRRHQDVQSAVAARHVNAPARNQHSFPTHID